MNLQKRRLKHILRHLRAAEVATEVAEQLMLVAVHERLERGRIVPGTNPTNQFLIGRPRPLQHRLRQRRDGRTAAGPVVMP